ncbi:MAG: hypothetical protein M3P22_00280 [bacterium]|nr:hypothetical protein [bacterium]
MENNKNNNTMWIVLGVVVLALIVFFVMRNKDKDTDVEVNDDQAQKEIVNNDPEGIEDVEVTAGATIPPASLSYQQALVKYKDARIQLDKTCQGSPDRMAVKNGSSIMIDNRAPNDRTVKLGSTYNNNIKGWGFRIIKLESATLPATWLLDCTESATVRSQNASTILIQK